MKSDYENFLYRIEVYILYYEKVVKGVFLSYIFFFKKKSVLKFLNYFAFVVVVIFRFY